MCKKKPESSLFVAFFITSDRSDSIFKGAQLWVHPPSVTVGTVPYIINSIRITIISNNVSTEHIFTSNIGKHTKISDKSNSKFYQ